MLEVLLTADMVLQDQGGSPQSDSPPFHSPIRSLSSVHQRVLFSQTRKDTVWRAVVSIAFLVTFAARVALTAVNIVQEVELSTFFGSTFSDFVKYETYEVKIAVGDDGCNLQQTSYQQGHNGHNINWNCTTRKPTQDNLFNQTSQCFCQLSVTHTCADAKMNIDNSDYWGQMYKEGSIRDDVQDCTALTRLETYIVVVFLVRNADRAHPQIAPAN